MSEVNLDDLKINHQARSAQRHFPLGVMALVFLVGVAAGGAVLYFWPHLIPGNEVALQTPVEENNNPVDEVPDPVEESIPDSFTEGGWVEVPSYHPVVVSSLIAGRLEELHVLEGSKVTKGQVIGRIFDRDFQDEVDKVQADVRTAEANLARLKAGFRKQEVARARADVEAAEAEMKLKEQVFRRTESLLETGAVSAEDLDRDRAAFEVAAARVETLRQEMLLKEEGYRKEDIQKAEAELEQRKALLDLAKNQLEYTLIKSPITGAVLERYVTPGTYIPATNPKIVSLYDPTDLQVRVDVRQEHISDVFLDQVVEVVTDAEPGRKYAGKVIRIEPLADFKKNTIQVKIKLSGTSEHLHPEMIARIRFMRRDHEQSHGEN